MNNKHKIIVIEDDKDINRLISYNLQKEGFVVESVYDGYEAQDKLQTNSFPIIILDLMLPGVDGFTICSAVKKRHNFLKSFVVVVSARTSTHDRVRAHLLGADYYLTKPFRIAELMRIVRELNSIM